MIQLWTWRLTSFIWQRLPPSLGYRLAGLIADLVYYLWPRGRRLAQENMGYVLGGQGDRRSTKQLARQSLRNYCKYLVDFIRFPLLRPEEIEKRVIFDGWERLDAALEGGRGAIFVGLHLGNWDLAAAALAQRNYPINVIAESLGHPKLNRMVQQTRRRLGVNVIMLEEVGQNIVRLLRRNEILAFLIDRPSPDDGVAVDFFGALTRVPAGAATLALKTGARIVPGGLVYLDDGTYLGLADHYLRFQPSGNLKEDVQALTQRIMTSLEAMVRQYPDQWYMFRRMWPEPVC